MLRIFSAKNEVDSKYIFMLAFMLALFSSGVPPEIVILHLSREDSFEPYTKVFKKIRNLVSGYRYKFSSAITYSIKNLNIRFLKEFLIRLSQAVTFGDDMIEFLSREIDFTLSEYNAYSARLIESMNNFLTIYATLNSSLTFLVADITILSLIYSGGTTLIIQLTILSLALLGNLTLVMYLLYRPENYIRYNVIDKFVLTFTISLSIIFSVIYTSYIVLMGTGIVLLGIGLRYRLYENKINRIERHFLLFIRYFSRNYAIVSNLKESLMAVLRGDLGDVRPLIRRSLNRLNFGIDKEKIFRLIGDESGSILVSMLSKVLYETISMGGNAMIIGEILSKIGDSVLNIRSRKEQNGRAFETSIYALQTASAGVSAALISIVGMLNNIFSTQNVSTVFSFSEVNIDIISRIFLIILLILSFANGIAITLAYGKSLYVSLYFIGILIILSSISYHIVLILTGNIFKELASPSGLLQTT
ncbi:flagellar protein FlaJ [Saccharolobus solfataricus]|uniref:Flagellar protein FlaJ n=3 Tax=Saccharolobus solfataricus TaxID=2287 RepID=A0A0E3MEC3_SACSO|nr:type II secretion system F family protein [Saccharolobus solfataricus]AAK42470.1 Flagella-related protein J, putative (FlaJ) [Saccharolobus solfataricus P2]AKA72570.1 flagellar protein FlaJ [Saccharolobus solfataricus]AKA75269.1 flagellar protein FlaJ [Saccharolobus solfataricus]AKA77962.1 flagellar protein FlaJ [Saccharolobus solfataricus]AZF67080.1 flagellar protein FlaJ [Saccharolobus solfataricus]